MPKLALLGDIGLTERLIRTGRSHVGPRLTDLLRSVDCVFGNLELPIHCSTCPRAPWTHNSLKGTIEALPILTELRVSVVGLATNHSMDSGRRGILNTIAALSSIGIESTGAGISEKLATKQVIVNVCGLRFGFISLCKAGPGSASGSRPGASLLTPKRAYDLTVRACTECDYVIFSMHAGMEFSQYVIPAQREVAWAAIDAGAKVVVGHHPHVLQGIDVYEGIPIFYSLGNFLFDNRIGAVECHNFWEERHHSIVPVLEFMDDQVSWMLHPVMYDDHTLTVEIAEGSDSNLIMDELDRISNHEYLFREETKAQDSGLAAILRRDIRIIIALALKNGPAYLIALLRDLKPRHLRMVARSLVVRVFHHRRI